MDLSLDAASGTGLLGILVADSQTTRRALDQLTAQAADGKIADTYAGLGDAAAKSLTLGPALAANQALQTNIGAATAPMQTALSAMQRISDVASSFYSETESLNGLNSSNVDTIAASARDALGQVASLLDTTYGNAYVFAGQDSANPPIPSPADITASGFFKQISAAVSNLSQAGASAVIGTTLAIAQSNSPGTSPFSAALSQPGPALETLRTAISLQNGQVVATGVLASANSVVISTCSTTTGSYMRDILRALATIGSLSSSQVNETGFSDVVADARSSLNGAIVALNQDAGVLGNREASLSSDKQTLSDTATTLQAQLSNVEDVDMTKTLASLSSAQTQLQASYELISQYQAFSLVKFLPSA